MQAGLVEQAVENEGFVRFRNGARRWRRRVGRSGFDGGGRRRLKRTLAPAAGKADRGHEKAGKRKAAKDSGIHTRHGAPPNTTG
jgi:hypothetical protein